MDETAVRAIRDLALAGAGIHMINGIPTSIRPKDVDVIPLREFMTRPDRIRESFITGDYLSFIRYIANYRTIRSSDELFCTVSGDGKSPKMSAAFTFDYHNVATGEAGNRDHVAKYHPETSVEWSRWTGNDGSFVPQDKFADFIESNVPDIHVPKDDPEAPSGATMLTLAKELQLTANIDVDSRSDRASGGVSFKYVEKVEGKHNGKHVTVPEHFYIAIPMHVGGPAYVIKVLFRFRRVDQHVKMGYELYRVHKLYESALETLVEQVGTDIDGIGVYR